MFLELVQVIKALQHRMPMKQPEETLYSNVSCLISHTWDVKMTKQLLSDYLIYTQKCYYENMAKLLLLSVTILYPEMIKS